MLDHPATDCEEAALAALRPRLQGSNVNPRTLLATDYLNHFNEIVMLLEILPACPECLEDALQWQPKGYAAHFAASGIADRLLAIEAYALSPAQYRAPFDALVSAIDSDVLGVLADLQARLREQDEVGFAALADSAAGRLKERVAEASGLIHGGGDPLAQDLVDALLA